MVTDERADRAQLVLIAAIAIAFVILGIVVVFNSVLYTQTISSGGSIEAGEDVRGAQLEVDRGVSGLAQELNRNGEYDDDGDPNPEVIEENVSVFADRYGNATMESRPSLVGVGLEGITTNGTLIHQPPSETLDDGERPIFNDSAQERFYLEYFELTVSVDNSVDGMTIQEVDDPTSELLEFEHDAGTINMSTDSGHCELEPSGSYLTVEVVHGETDAVGDTSCLSNVTSEFDGSYQGLAFDDGEDVEVSFEVVLDDDAGNYEHYDPGENDYVGEEPLDAVTGLDVALEYDSSDVAYDRTQEIRVYGDLS